jgi:hypothetical protein
MRMCMFRYLQSHAQTGILILTQLTSQKYVSLCGCDLHPQTSHFTDHLMNCTTGIHCVCTGHILLLPDPPNCEPSFGPLCLTQYDTEAVSDFIASGDSHLYTAISSFGPENQCNKALQTE